MSHLIAIMSDWLLLKVNHEVLSSLGGPKNGSCSHLHEVVQVFINKREYLFGGGGVCSVYVAVF